VSSAVQEPGACCNAGSRIDRLASGVAELRELSLAINTPEGMAIVVGFSHPGIDNIVAAATPVMRTSRKVTALHDTFKVEYVAPGHCTGEPAFAALKKAFGDRYMYAGLGTMLELLLTSQR
jgi:7,8-dihydropterin-6-yl-methyl-4-(beta-D-ribofuranosyl)aminobenzene 5'-phosphate synthase